MPQTLQAVIADALSALGLGLLTLAAVQVPVSVMSWVVLRTTVTRARMRVALLLALVVVYHVAVWFALAGPTVMAMALLFVWMHLGFTFRLLSSIYYHRRGGPAPGFAFHVVHTFIGPRQHYGAASREELGGRRFSRALLWEQTKRIGYQLVMVGVAVLLIALAISDPRVPFRIAIVSGAWFILGLEALTLVADVHVLCWSFAGHHQRFFGNYAWWRSKHVGQWWKNWNQHAIQAFGELSRFAGIRRHYFWNTMLVFSVSGVLHQIMVYYYMRQWSYGTILSFLIYGALVWAFGRLYHARKHLPTAVRVAVFNPVTNLVVVLAAGLPFVMDFYGRFTF